MSEPRVSQEFLTLQAAVIGRYSLVRELGRGGMGVVFLAREVALDRLVAIKLLPPALGANPVWRERFLREARTAAQLSHPHIVAIHGVEVAGDLAWFVMEYVAGESLGERLRRVGALPMAEALRTVQELCWAIAHAHARGVVHRDVKPDNVLLEDGSDRVLVTDFGIARAATGETPTPPGVSVMMGTLHYMSPEQGNGAAGDERSDIYAIGVTAWQLFAGRRPFEGSDGPALLAAQQRGDPPALRTLVPALPPRIAEAIDRAVRSDPAVRWPSAEALAQELAAGRALAPQLPVPLRRFGRHALEHSDRLATALGAGLSAVIAAGIVNVTSDGFLDALAFYAMGYFTAGVVALMLAQHLLHLREVVAAGYGERATVAALRRIEREEMPAVAPRTGPWHDARVLVAGGVVLCALGVWLTTVANGSLLIGLGGLFFAVIAPARAWKRAAETRSGGTSWWTRVLGSRVGAGLFRLAGIGLPRIAPAPVPAEPTALALGGAVGALYAGLPAHDREALAAVPELLVRLEARALDAGDAARFHAIAALETLRLDLLRLQAGQLAASSITRDLEQLREIGFRIDAAIEVDGAVSRPA